MNDDNLDTLICAAAWIASFGMIVWILASS